MNNQRKDILFPIYIYIYIASLGKLINRTVVSRSDIPSLLLRVTCL